MTEHSTPDTCAPVPAVVRRYAAYLRAKTQITLETTVDGDRADTRATTGDGALTLLFRCSGKNEWSLRGGEVQRGTQTATFVCGQVASAAAVFLGDEPLTRHFPAGKDRHAS